MEFFIIKGANLLIKYAGLQKEKCCFKAIVSIANPYNLLTCSQNILKFKNKIYDFSITTNFKNLLKKHKKELAPNIETKAVDIEKALNARNTYEFDEYLTRRLFDFNSVEELYLVSDN